MRLVNRSATGLAKAGMEGSRPPSSRYLRFPPTWVHPHRMPKSGRTLRIRLASGFGAGNAGTRRGL